MAEKGLGIRLFKPSLGVDHFVGARYWSIDENGHLGAPLFTGSIWKPGLNRGLTSGLFSFHYEPGLDQTGYFTLSTGHIHASGDFVIGGIAYWVPTTPLPLAGQIVSGKYAAVAALTMPPDASEDMKLRVKKAAEYYQVEIIEHTQLKDTVDAYVESRLPGFYDPPLKPLFILTGQGEQYTAPHNNRWSFTPRRHRARPAEPTTTHAARP